MAPPSFKLKSLDIFGQEFSFKATKSTQKFQTKCGAIATLFCIVLTAIGFYIFTADYLDTENPRVTISSERENTYPEVNLFQNGFLPAATVLNISKAVTSDKISRYLTLAVVKIKMIFDSPTSQGVYKIVGSQNYIDCRNAKNKEFIEDIVRKSGTELFYNQGTIICPQEIGDEDFWKSRGVPNDLPFQFISLMTFPCSLPDSSQCATALELAGIEIVFSLASQFYKLSDKKNPVKGLFEYDKLTFAIDPSKTHVTKMRFEKVRIMDEDKDFSQAKLKKEFFRIGDVYSYSRMRNPTPYCSPLQIMNGTCVPYIEARVMSGNNVETVLRVYPKMFSTISELGGFGDLVFIVVGLLYAFYNNYYFEKYEQKQLVNKNNIEEVSSLVEKKSQEVKKINEGFINNKMNGYEIINTSIKFDALVNILFSPEYKNAIEIIALIEEVKKEKDKNNNSSTKNKIEKNLAQRVLNSDPKNEFERLVKEKLEIILGRSKEEVLIEEVGGIGDTEKKAILGRKATSKVHPKF